MDRLILNPFSDTPHNISDISLDDIQQRRDERELYAGTTNDFSFEERRAARLANLYRLRLIASKYFQVENFSDLVERLGRKVEVYLALGKQIVGYGKNLTEAGKMAKENGIDSGDCLVMWSPYHDVLGWAGIFS